MSAHDFKQAAVRAQRRLVVAAWFDVLRRTAVPVVAAVAVAVIAVRLLGYRLPDLSFVALAIVGWLGATFAWCWLRRRDELPALAEWDRRAGRHEAFVSAYAFSQRDEAALDAGERLHLQRASGMLRDALPSLRRDLPARTPHLAWALPLVVLVFAASPLLLRDLRFEERPLDAAAAERAALVAEQLAEQPDLEKLPGMTEEEQEKAGELRKAMEQMAEELGDKPGRTPQEVLADLEALARQAEALAEAMGEGESAKVSSAMIEELERHADTGDFGSALRADKSDQAAQEARAISDRLRAAELTLDEQQRFADAFDRAMNVASDKDRKTLVGQHLNRADEQMAQRQPPRAGEEFQRLADALDRRAQREGAQERLEQLAAEMRAGGQRIMDSTAGGVRQLAQVPQGLRAVTPGGQRGAQQQANGQRGRLPLPGSGKRSTYTVSQGNWGQGNLPPGSGRPGAGGAGNLPPIPGSMLTQQSLGQCQGLGSPLDLIPGGMGQRQGGGLRAGRGTSALGGARTNPLAPTGTGNVSAPPANPGASAVQDVEGQQHREETERDRREVAMQFIAAQEDALADESLPLSRREQVLTYFRLLRSNLE